MAGNQTEIHDKKSGTIFAVYSIWNDIVPCETKNTQNENRNN